MARLAELSGSQVDAYKYARPEYPDQWFKMLAGQTNRHERAWDVGTGNGQAARKLPKHYKRVVATDINQELLERAEKHPQIEYHLTPKSMSEDKLVACVGGDNSIDLVTAAQAVHYFDLDKFYAVVKRVLRKPGGVIAVWVFNHIVVSPEVDRVFERLAEATKPFRTDETNMALSGYNDLPFPFKSIGIGSEGNSKPLKLEKEMTRDSFFAYLRSWQLIVKAKKAGVDLLTDELMSDFRTAWGPNPNKAVVYKYFMVAGTCSPDDYGFQLQPLIRKQGRPQMYFRPLFPERLQAFKMNYKHGHLMEVQHFSLLKKRNIFQCISSIFEISGYKWQLVVKLKDYVSMFVEIKDTSKVVKADLHLLILNHNDLEKSTQVQRFNRSFSSAEKMIGVENVLPLDTLLNERQGYCKDDSVIFAVGIKNVQPCCFHNSGVRTIGTAECHKVMELERPKNIFTWKITKFSTFNQYEHDSHAFVVGDRKWRLKFFPKGDSRAVNSMSVYLMPDQYLNKNAPKGNTLVRYNLRVLDQLHQEHCEGQVYHYFTTDLGYGFRNFLSLEDLKDKYKGFLVNDTIFIGVEFLVVSTTTYC